MTFVPEIDRRQDIPAHAQIAAQFRRAILTGGLAPGDRLPTVRDLARRVGVNTNTIARAYSSLASERLIETRRGGGSIVAADATARLARARDAQLQQLVDDLVARAVALGFSIDEVYRAVGHRVGVDAPTSVRDGSVPSGTATPGLVTIAGSHDLSLDLLVRRLAAQQPPVRVELRYCGSLDGLVALARGEADVAACHLLDGLSGEYNTPFVRRLLPGRAISLITLARRQQGILTAPGNPKRLTEISDLARPDVTIVNRQPGAGTRVLLDLLLSQRGINPLSVRGYDRELPTHLAVAAAIARGDADAGLGIEAAATTYGLSFIPVAIEPFQLVIPREQRDRPEIQAIAAVTRDPALQQLVDRLGGYDTTTAGSEEFLD